jgi:hypothetical protein
MLGISVFVSQQIVSKFTRYLLMENIFFNMLVIYMGQYTCTQPAKDFVV